MNTRLEIKPALMGAAFGLVLAICLSWFALSVNFGSFFYDYLRDTRAYEQYQGRGFSASLAVTRPDIVHIYVDEGREAMGGLRMAIARVLNALATCKSLPPTIVDASFSPEDGVGTKELVYEILRFPKKHKLIIGENSHNTENRNILSAAKSVGDISAPIMPNGRCCFDVNPGKRKLMAEHIADAFSNADAAVIDSPIRLS